MPSDVERRHSGVPRARHRLHRGDEQTLDREGPVQRCEREREGRGGTVGVGEDGAAPPACLALAVDQYQVIGVGLGNEEWNVRLHAMRAGVGDHVRPRAGESLLDGPGHVGIERGEGHRPRERRRALGNREIRDRGRQIALLPPPHHVAEALARAGGRRRHGGDLEPGVVGQEPHELLAHRAGGAEDADRGLRAHGASRERRSAARRT